MAVITTAQDTRANKKYVDRHGIYPFGYDNLYPNNTVTISNHSSALKRCLTTYERFIFGKGMTLNNDFWKMIVNRSGLTVDQFLRRIVSDYTKHGGFAFKIIYNGLAEPAGFVPLPFETLRLCKADDEGRIVKVAYHPDWSHNYIQTKDIKYYDVYNPDVDAIYQQAIKSGGFEKYKGQIYYFGENGELKYPYNSFHAVLEDCITDIAIKRGKNANVSTNFLASHIMQLPFTFADMAEKVSTAEKTIDAEEAKEKFIKSMQEFQSNENTGKIMTIENTAKDADGKMIPLKFDKIELQNYDKLNEYTESSIKENIRENYIIPPILISRVATGFSTEIFESAYAYYNEITYFDRLIFEETFEKMFRNTDFDKTDTFKIVTL